MQRPSWIWSSLFAAIVGIVLTTPAGAATPDAWITTKAKLALLTTEGVSGTAINVDTVLGRVTLHGKVHSPEEKAKAEALTQKIEGVTSVHNLLQVVAPSREKAMQVSDDALKERIAKGIDIEVKNGVVRLTGTVPSGARRLEAAVAARAVPGVRAVEDDLRLEAAGH